MKITPEQLQAQTEGLVKMVGLETPPQIGVIAILIDRQTGILCLRAAKIDRERVKETLRACLEGYGKQVVTEAGVDRVN